MAGDFNKPALTDGYSAFAQSVRELAADIAKGLDPALSLATANIPTNTIRWNSNNRYWEKYDGISWGQLVNSSTNNYGIRAATSDAWYTGRTISLSGDVSATSTAWTGSDNLSITGLTLATVNTATGTFGSASAVPIITVNGKGLITNISTTSIGSLASQNSNGVTITGGTISGTTIQLSQASAVAPTSEGEIRWDTDDDLIALGITGSTKYFAPLIPTSTVTMQSHVMSTGCVWNGGAVPVANGGTGSTDAGAARTALGIGSIGTQNSNSVTITGGTISGSIINVQAAAGAAPTAEGRLQWDSTSKTLMVGDGSITVTLVNRTGAQSLTNKALGTGCSYAGDAIPIANGGTGASSTSQALDNLLPAGEQPGYVLKTTGPGSYSWQAESGTGTNFGTLITSSRVHATATGGQTVFSGLGTYVIGQNQTRVYVNGARLYSEDYVESTTSSITLSEGCRAGDKVMIEVDGYTSYNPSAANISVSPVGNISSTTVQNAISELDSEKLSSATNSTQAGYFGDIYLFDDTTPSHYLQITNSANLSAQRTLSINVNDGSRTLSFSGNLTVSGDVTISGTFSGSSSGTNTGDQTITLSGIVTGTGTAGITTTWNGTSSNLQMGSLGVGTAASGTTGEILATNNITANYSDERLKTRLGNIENALDKLEQIDCFYYEANELAQSLGYKPIREVGLSAQSVRQVLPEVVAPAPIDNKYLTVRYERLVPLLIEAIKELNRRLNAN